MVKFIKDFKSFDKNYYYFNLLNIIEKSAWFILIIQLPIYLSQKGVEGGLEYPQYVKGYIYFYWAFLQNTIPLFAGNIIQNLANKKLILFLSFLVLFLAFLLLAFIQNLIGIFIAVSLISIGLGFFRPLAQGSIASGLKNKNSSLAWGSYFWIYNLIIFIFATPFSKFLREISWEAVFIGASCLMLLNMILSFFYVNKPTAISHKINLKALFKKTRLGIFEKSNLLFLLSMSGFSIIYMQFYETLPNFIWDWIDSNDIINFLNLGETFKMATFAGEGLSFEWIYNINTLVTLIFLIPSSIYFKKYTTINSLRSGLLIIIIGFLFCIFFNSGLPFVFGIFIYSLGELIVNPKFVEHIGLTSDKDSNFEKMGYLFFANLIGYTSGAILGGYLYGNFGEKESLARKYLIDNYSINAEYNQAYLTLIDKLNHLSETQITNMLWEIHNPQIAFYPFIIIGILSIIGLSIYKSKYK